MKILATCASFAIFSYQQEKKKISQFIYFFIDFFFRKLFQVAQNLQSLCTSREKIQKFSILKNEKKKFIDLFFRKLLQVAQLVQFLATSGKASNLFKLFFFIEFMCRKLLQVAQLLQSVVFF